MTASSMKSLAAEYHSLSHDEYQYFVELGMRMTLEGRWKQIQKQQAVRAEDSTAATATAMVVSSSTTKSLLDLGDHTSFQLQLLGDNFQQRLQKFWGLISADSKAFGKMKNLVSKPVHFSHF